MMVFEFEEVWLELLDASWPLELVEELLVEKIVLPRISTVPGWEAKVKDHLLRRRACYDHVA